MSQMRIMGFVCTMAAHFTTVLLIALAAMVTPRAHASIAAISNLEDMTFDAGGGQAFAVSVESNALLVLTRDRVSGALVERQRVKLDGLTAPRIARSNDSTTLFVIDAPVKKTSDIANPGRLRVLRQGTDGIWSVTQSFVNGEGGVSGMGGARAITVSADGKHVYIASSADNALAHFTVANDGLRYAQAFTQGNFGIDGLHGVVDVALAGHADYLYTIATFRDQQGADQVTLTVFKRNVDDGLLATFQVLTSARGDDGIERLTAPTSVVEACDGGSVFVGSAGSDGVLRFKRDANTGQLVYTADGSIFSNTFEAQVTSTGRQAVAINGLTSVHHITRMCDDSPDLFAVSAANLVKLMVEPVTGAVRYAGVEPIANPRGLTTRLAISPGGDVYALVDPQLPIYRTSVSASPLRLVVNATVRTSAAETQIYWTFENVSATDIANTSFGGRVFTENGVNLANVQASLTLSLPDGSPYADCPYNTITGVWRCPIYVLGSHAKLTARLTIAPITVAAKLKIVADVYAQGYAATASTHLVLDNLVIAQIPGNISATTRVGTAVDIDVWSNTQHVSGVATMKVVGVLSQGKWISEQGGSLTLVALDNGADGIRYTPPPGFTGVDYFQYKLLGDVLIGPARTKITVFQLPLAVDDRFVELLNTQEYQLRVIDNDGAGNPDDHLHITKIYTADDDPQRYSLHAKDATLLEIADDQTIRFRATAGYVTQNRDGDTFGYEMSDGGGVRSIATVSVNITAPPNSDSNGVNGGVAQQKATSHAMMDASTLMLQLSIFVLALIRRRYVIQSARQKRSKRLRNACVCR